MSTLVFYFPGLLLFVLAAVYVERKIAAFIQDRLGPMEVGYRGLGQTLADMLKLLQKEAILPAAADKRLFVLAPAWMFTTVLAAFAVLPVTATWTGAPTATGVLYLLAMASLEVLGIWLAGWASNNKYARLGAMRALVQIVSYEVPLGLSILCVVVASQTLDLQAMSWQQCVGGAGRMAPLLPYAAAAGNACAGFWTWNVFRVPSLGLAYCIFFVTSLAACHRAPFDLPESESELIGGHHTEYSGLRWAWMMLAEYGKMLLMALLGVILFWGSWQTPFPDWGRLRLGTWTSGTPGTWLGHCWAGGWLFAKAFVIVGIQMWMRWTFPRLRFDQLMRLCWLYLTPMALMLLLLTIGLLI
ncbi:MAG: complex I subunit 1 family protein [Bacteroidota bacterium]